MNNQIDFYWNELKAADQKDEPSAIASKAEEIIEANKHPKLEDPEQQPMKKEADLIKQAMNEALHKARRTDNPNRIYYETLQMLIWLTQHALNEIHDFKNKDPLTSEATKEAE